HGLGGVDVLDLHGFQGDAPVGDVVGNRRLELGLDVVTGRQGVVQVHLADDGTERRLHQGLDGDLVALDAVHRLLGKEDVDVGHGVGNDHRVVPGDHLLGGNIEDNVLGGHLVG